MGITCMANGVSGIDNVMINLVTYSTVEDKTAISFVKKKGYCEFPFKTYLQEVQGIKNQTSCNLFLIVVFCVFTGLLKIISLILSGQLLGGAKTCPTTYRK